MNLDKANIRKILGLIAFAIIVNAAVNNLSTLSEAIWALVGVSSPVLIGVTLAYLVNIPMSLFERKVFRPRGKRALKLQRTLRRPLSLILSLALVLLIIISVSLILVPSLVGTVSGLFTKLPEWVDQGKARLLQFEDDAPELIHWIESLSFDWTAIQSSVIRFMQQGLGTAMSNVISTATSVFGTVTSGALAIVFALSAVCTKEVLVRQAKRLLRAYLKPAAAERAISIASITNRAFSGFITGQVTEACILGSLVLVLMTLLRFPNAFLIATIAAVMAIIPIFGAFITAIIGMMLVSASSGFMQGLGFLIFFIVLQQLEGNLIYPRVMGSRIGLPALWVLVAITVGGGLFGIPGMLVSIPLFAVFYTLLRESVRDREHERIHQAEKGCSSNENPV